MFAYKSQWNFVITGWPMGGVWKIVIKLQITKAFFAFVEDKVGRTWDLNSWPSAAMRFREILDNVLKMRAE